MGFKTIFTVLDKTKHPNKSDIEKIPSFMFCKWLGNHPYTVRAANEINKFYKYIPVYSQYKMIKTVFSGKNIYIKFLKADKVHDQYTIDILTKHYKINEEKAQEYIKILDDKELADILELYK